VTAFLNLRRRQPESIVYVLGCALVPAGLLAYVVWHQALAAAFDDVVLHTVTRYASIQIVPFGFEGVQPALTYLFPLAALLTLLVCSLDWRNCLRDRLLWSCAAFGLAGFLGCFPRPDPAHIAYAAPLAFPLLACCMTRLTQRWYRNLVIACVVIGLCVPSALYFSRISQEVWRTEIVPTPRGGVAFFGQRGPSELLARIAATPPGDAYFFYPYDTMLPFLAARGQVSKYDVFTPGYTLPAEYRDACISVMRHASWVVIDRRMADPKLLKQVFPAMRDAEPRETKRFEQALDESFELIAQEGAYQLRRRREGISDAICANVAE